MNDWDDMKDEPDEFKPEHSEYSTPAFRQFIKDMEEEGLDTWYYRGRNFWSGPAVDVDDIQDALRATRVRCQWDNLGRGFVVYPKEYKGAPPAPAPSRRRR